MKDVVLDEVMKALNWRERIIAKIFKKTFCKIFNAGVKRGFNWSNKL